MSESSRNSKQAHAHPDLAADLARRLQNTSALLAASYRDLQSQKVVRRLIKDVFGLDDASLSSADLNEQFLQTVMEHTLSDVACLFRASSQRGEFSLISGLAPGRHCAPPNELVLMDAPEFFCIPSDCCPPAVAEVMISRFGLAKMVWVKEQLSGFALLLIKRPGSTIEWNYDSNSREMMDMVLSVYSETVSRVKLKSDMMKEKLEREAREVIRSRMVNDFLRSVKYSLENIQHNSQVAQALSSATEVTAHAESLRSILAEAGKTLSLARDMEVIFKLDTVDVQIRPTNVNFNQILKSILAEIEAEVTSRELKLTLVQADDFTHVCVDRTWIEEVLRAVFIFTVRSACPRTAIHMHALRLGASVNLDLRWRRNPGARVLSSSGAENGGQAAAEEMASVMHLVRSLGASLTFASSHSLPDNRVDRATLKIPEAWAEDESMGSSRSL